MFFWIKTAFCLSVKWFAPFLSGGGYCSEAISYVEAYVNDPVDHIELGIQHVSVRSASNFDTLF